MPRDPAQIFTPVGCIDNPAKGQLDGKTYWMLSTNMNGVYPTDPTYQSEVVENDWAVEYNQNLHNSKVRLKALQHTAACSCCHAKIMELLEGSMLKEASDEELGPHQGTDFFASLCKPFQQNEQAGIEIYINPIFNAIDIRFDRSPTQEEQDEMTELGFRPSTYNDCLWAAQESEITKQNARRFFSGFKNRHLEGDSP